MAELDVTYVRDGWEICMVEYGTNVRLVKDLIKKGFKPTQVLPPDEKEDISFCLVWTRPEPKPAPPDVPKIVIAASSSTPSPGVVQL